MGVAEVRPLTAGCAVGGGGDWRRTGTAGWSAASPACCVVLVPCECAALEAGGRVRYYDACSGNGRGCLAAAADAGRVYCEGAAATEPEERDRRS